MRGGTTDGRVQGQGVISFHQPPADIFEISYKNHKTGKIRRWNLMDAPFQELPNGVYNQSGDVDSEVAILLFFRLFLFLLLIFFLPLLFLLHLLLFLNPFI